MSAAAVAVRDSRMDLLKKLIVLTTKQIEAAKRLDGPTLAELGLERADLSFELRCAMDEPASPEVRARLVADARKLKRLEARLSTIAQTVTSALDRAMPPKNVVTYGRSGRVG